MCQPFSLHENRPLVGHAKVGSTLRKLTQPLALGPGSPAGDGQNTDPQSKDYPNGLPKWTTLKCTTPKNNILNEYYLMFLASSRVKLYIYKFRLCLSCTCGPYWKINRDNAEEGVVDI